MNRTYGASAVLRMFDTWLPLVGAGEPTEDKPTVSFTPPDEPDRVSVAFAIRGEDCPAAYKELVADALRSSPRLGWCRSPRLAPLDHKAPSRPGELRLLHGQPGRPCMSAAAVERWSLVL